MNNGAFRLYGYLNHVLYIDPSVIQGIILSIQLIEIHFWTCRILLKVFFLSSSLHLVDGRLLCLVVSHDLHSINILSIIFSSCFIYYFNLVILQIKCSILIGWLILSLITRNCNFKYSSIPFL